MRPGRWWMLGVTCLSVVVVNLDLTVLNIALPAISAALQAGGLAVLSQVHLATGYAFVAAGLAA
jgi:hypothetical protein